MSWRTSDNFALLRHLASQGKSANFIAWQMGSNCTRNAVVGYCQRKGIHLTGKPGKQGIPEKKREIVKTERRNFGWSMKPSPAKRTSPLADPTLSDPKWSCSTSIALMDARDIHCRWPVGSPAMRCCGNKVVHQSYCEKHADVAFLGRWRRDPVKQIVYSE